MLIPLLFPALSPALSYGSVGIFGEQSWGCRSCSCRAGGEEPAWLTVPG